MNPFRRLGRFVRGWFSPGSSSDDSDNMANSAVRSTVLFNMEQRAHDHKPAPVPSDPSHIPHHDPGRHASTADTSPSIHHSQSANHASSPQTTSVNHSAHTAGSHDGSGGSSGSHDGGSSSSHDSGSSGSYDSGSTH